VIKAAAAAGNGIPPKIQPYFSPVATQFASRHRVFVPGDCAILFVKFGLIFRVVTKNFGAEQMTPQKENFDLQSSAYHRKLRLGLAGGLILLLVIGCNSSTKSPTQEGGNLTVTLGPSQTPVPVISMTPSMPLPPPFTNTPAPTPTPTTQPSELTDDKGVVMRLVPAGLFSMGSNNGQPDEKPVHQVDLPAFYLDKYEVTNVLYQACVDAGVCQVPANTSLGLHGGSYGTYGNPQFEHYPVIWVDWNMAKTYCEWRGARLPSEPEWEKAARGTDGRTYPWGERIDPTFANYGRNAPDEYNEVFGRTTAVGSYENNKSPYGIYDLAGNVWEWVADWYDVYPGGDVSVNPAFGQTYRVVRGGAWDTSDYILRTTFRGGNYPNTTVNYIGFRCAR
jgi:formylglycine-generating enzyme required for sulfatase activity